MSSGVDAAASSVFRYRLSASPSSGRRYQHRSPPQHQQRVKGLPSFYILSSVGSSWRLFLCHIKFLSVFSLSVCRSVSLSSSSS